ncbi:EamA family transporter RarD [Bacillota bacterium]
MACAILCASLWGVLPVYWKSLNPIEPILIMFYRLVLACLIVFAAALITYGWKGIIEPAKKKGALFSFISAGMIISINWALFIFMVNTGRVVQTCIGYYIEPLVICAFGIIFFKEKPNKFKTIAIALALLGVSVMLLSFGQIPVLALLLAVSFASYAAIKKKVQAPALISLFYETVFIAPIAIAVILYMELKGLGAFTVAEPRQIGLLFLSGLFTAVPLSLFAMGANRISLFALGLTEYISPSLSLILGVFLFREPFDIYQFIGFVIIWIGLAVFSADDIMARKAARALPVTEELSVEK